MKLTRRKFLYLSGLGSALLRAGKKGPSQDLRVLPRKPTSLPAYDAWVELNLHHLGFNLEKVRNLAKVPVMAVIKANGYGHGLIETGQFLESQGIDSLMVGKLQEALGLREAGIRSPILNFGPLLPEHAYHLVAHDIMQSVFTSEVLALDQIALKAGKRAKVQIHVDTGLGRMGIPYYEALPFIEKVAPLKGIHIAGISTTLTEDPEFDSVQLERFLSLCTEAEKRGIALGPRHAASSAGLFLQPSFRLGLVRPGIALYGYYPSEKTQEEDSLGLKPVLSLKSRVAAVKTLRPGDSVSYHRAYVARKEEKIAVIPVGYSDGYPSSAAGKGSVLIKEKRFPIIATITANHLEVLLEKDSPIQGGDEAVLIGNQGREKITAAELGGWAGLSTYKILLSLNPLLPRVVV